ncbi:MAG: TSUP family transporter [Bacteroidetes bacterium]|nr:TSUP family transporter [Bacteroidota bacterium]
MLIDLTTYLLMFSFAFTAGFIDSIVGGGGLIQMPAMLILFSGMPIPTLMGTNKFAAFAGTAIATVRYVKQTEVPWKAILPAMLTATIFSFLGAQVISHINKEDIKIIVLSLLIAVAIYTFWRKDFGLTHEPKLNAFKTALYSLITGALLGFYDGFFGPGTGSFLIVIFISLFGFNFLVSSASAKLVNCATNISALTYFIYTGQINYQLAIPIALFNMAGSFFGAKMAIKKGSAFVRTLFLVIVTCMILKFGYDIFST